MAAGGHINYKSKTQPETKQKHNHRTRSMSVESGTPLAGSIQSANRQTETDRQTASPAGRQAGGQADRDRQRQTDRDGQRRTESDRDRQRQTETDRDRGRQTDRQRQTDSSHAEYEWESCQRPASGPSDSGSWKPTGEIDIQAQALTITMQHVSL